MNCQQKYCKYCVKPTFSLDGKFVYGQCKISRYLTLRSDKECTKEYNVQPLYCYEYTPRKRNIKY